MNSDNDVIATHRGLRPGLLFRRPKGRKPPPKSRIATLRERFVKGLDLFSGEPLSGSDAINSEELRSNSEETDFFLFPQGGAAHG